MQHSDPIQTYDFYLSAVVMGNRFVYQFQGSHYPISMIAIIISTHETPGSTRRQYPQGSISLGRRTGLWHVIP